MGSMAPSTGVVLRQDLMDLAEEMDFSKLGLCADILAPVLPVEEAAAYYPVMPRESILSVPDTRRAADGSYQRGQWVLSDSMYATRHYGFEQDIDNISQMVWEKYVDQEEVNTKLAIEGVLKAREYRFSRALFNTSTFSGTGNTFAITNEWDDAANATPWKDVDDIWQLQRAKCGFPKEMYTLVISDDNFNNLMKTNEIVNSVQYTEAVATMAKSRRLQFAADYFGIKEVKTTSAIMSYSNPNSAADIGKYYSNEYGMLAVLSQGERTFREQSVARQLIWTRYSTNYTVETYADPAHNKMIVRAGEYHGQLIRPDYGCLITNMKTTVGSNGV